MWIHHQRKVIPRPSDGAKKFRRQHFCRRQSKVMKTWLPHLTCGAPRRCTIAQHRVPNNALSPSHQNQSGLIITSQHLQHSLLLYRGITRKQSPLWHTEEIRRVPTQPQILQKTHKVSNVWDDSEPLHRSISSPENTFQPDVFMCSYADN